MSTIIGVRHTRMWTLRWTPFKFYSKLDKKVQVRCMEVCTFFFFELFLCSAHVISSIKFIKTSYGTGGCYIHYEREVMSEDVTAPPRARLGTLTSTLDAHATGFPPRSSPSAVVLSFVVCWLSCEPSVPTSTLRVRPHPLTRGRARGEVGRAARVVCRG